MAYVFITLTITFTVVGQLAVKWGMLSVGPRGAQADLVQYLMRVVLNPGFILGMSCAVIAALCWSLALTTTPLSVAYPFTALSIVLVLLLSGFVFGELVPYNRWLGVAIIALGLIVASRR